MSAHTPGPWFVGSGPKTKYGVFAGGPEGGCRTICYTATSQRERTPEMEAYARLIAAAPDLLEALRATIEREEHYAACNECGAPQNERPDLCPQGRHLSDRVMALRPWAIAKAEGR